MDKRIIEAAEAALREKHFDQNGVRADDKDWYLNTEDRSSGYDRVRVGERYAFVDLTVPTADLPALLNYQQTAEALHKLVNAIYVLMADSDGVSGLNRDGGVSRWSELDEGGRFSRWFRELREAEAVLTATTPKEGD